MKQKCKEYFVCINLVWLVCLFTFLPLQVRSFQLPKMPTGTVMDFKTKYRIVEYDPERAKDGIPRQVNIYDTNKVIKTNAKKINIYPPVYYQQYGLEKRWEGVEKVIVHNTFAPELVLIIENGDVLKVSRMKEYPKPLGTISKEAYMKGDGNVVDSHTSPKITAEQAKTIIISKLKHKNIWTLNSFPYKNGEIICGYNNVNPKAIAVWWVAENNIRNVNSVARGNTPKYELAFEPGASDGYDFCTRNTK